VGSSVGTLVATFEGEEVGPAVGESVGNLVGTTEGDYVGPAAGDTEGCCVAPANVDAVGPAVGDSAGWKPGFLTAEKWDLPSAKQSEGMWGPQKAVPLVLQAS
jgi:hypothetical protein